jgi:phosphoribosylamine--glycine ligase
LAAGIVDEFNSRHMLIFGPTRRAARIEGSKVFSKALMHSHGVPSSGSRSFDNYNQAAAYICQHALPVVVKVDGLAAGKGVTVAFNLDEALAALKAAMLDKVFGQAGEQVVIEEYLTGREMSAFAVSDGRLAVPLAYACDYKRIFDGNLGPNTGGMGSYSPPDCYDAPLGMRVMAEIMQPVVTALAAVESPYRGILYGGLILTGNGPKVIEFNARLGDPETQVMMPRLKTDLLDIIQAVLDGDVSKLIIDVSPQACVGVVMASGGYPGHFQSGYPIQGLDELDRDITVFHAATKIEKGKAVTNGGRVLTVVATGENLAAAREKIYNNISRIHFRDAYYRKDIAQL